MGTKFTNDMDSRILINGEWILLSMAVRVWSTIRE